MTLDAADPERTRSPYSRRRWLLLLLHGGQGAVAGAVSILRLQRAAVRSVTRTLESRDASRPERAGRDADGARARSYLGEPPSEPSELEEPSGAPGGCECSPGATL